MIAETHILVQEQAGSKKTTAEGFKLCYYSWNQNKLPLEALGGGTQFLLTAPNAQPRTTRLLAVAINFVIIVAVGSIMENSCVIAGLISGRDSDFLFANFATTTYTLAEL